MTATSKAQLLVPVARHVFSMQYISTPTADTPGTTLILQFDSKRYLFGRVSEGTQRVCTERGINLKKTRNFFLTGETKWDTNGGLLGMILTIADAASESTEEEKQAVGKIHIHGGPRLWHTMACARRFIFRTGMPLNTYEASLANWRPSNEPDFFDENVLLWALPVETADLSKTSCGTNAKIEEDQELRKRTVHNMFNSDWHKDRLHEATFSDVVLPAMIWVRDPTTKDLQATWCTRPSDAPHIAPDQKVLVRMPWPAALVTELPSADNLPSGVAMSYFVKGRPQRGRFMPNKAKAAGVPPGPKFGQLSSGNPITLEDGKVVNPEDVMGPIMPGYGTAILDIPHESYLPDLAAKLSKLREIEVLTDVHAFCWTLASGVAQSKDFKEIVEAFSDIKHFIAAPEYSANTWSMDASAASTTRLHSIRPDAFVIPRYNNSAFRTWDLPESCLPAQRGLNFQLAPDFKISKDNIPENVDIDVVREQMSLATKELIPRTVATDVPTNGPYDDISVTTLGTGSALPSKYRNVSANLLHIPSLGYFMFDCGENTLGQLKRIYNPEELDELLCNLHMVWISHLHADHHLGTVSLLSARKAAVQRRAEAGSPVKHNLYLISERNMADFLEEYKSVEHHNAIMIRCLNSALTYLDDQPVDLTTTTLPIRQLLSTRVSHCHGAQAVSVTFSNGFKISFSGDCRPSVNFAKIGKDSDILIHEATFDDGLEGDAVAKRHCTTGEALGVANAMRAKNIIFTHFSQRYQKLPTLTVVKSASQLKFEDEHIDANENGPVDGQADRASNSLQDLVTAATDTLAPGATGPETSGPDKESSLETIAKERPICIAFDFMRVTIPQIRDMHKYYPAFESMFEYEQQKRDDKRSAARAAEDALAETKKAKNGSKKDKNKAPAGDKQNGRKAKFPQKHTAASLTDDSPVTMQKGERRENANKRSVRSKSPENSEPKKQKTM